MEQSIELKTEYKDNSCKVILTNEERDELIRLKIQRLIEQQRTNEKYLEDQDFR